MNLGGLGLTYYSSDTEGQSISGDLNVDPASVQAGIGNDGKAYGGGSFGAGIGGSLSHTATATYTAEKFVNSVLCSAGYRGRCTPDERSKTCQ